MHVQRWRRICCGLVLSTVIVTASSAAHAFARHVTFCNKSKAAVDVAWGYDMTGTSETRSEGWLGFRSCECNTLFRQDVRATEFFVYVKRPDGGLEDALTSGSAPLCVRAKAFTIRASNVSRSVCLQSGGKWVNFQMVDARQERHTVNFGSGGVCAASQPSRSQPSGGQASGNRLGKPQLLD
jgi:uncharacterized membrane protein